MGHCQLFVKPYHYILERRVVCPILAGPIHVFGPFFVHKKHKEDIFVVSCCLKYNHQRVCGCHKGGPRSKIALNMSGFGSKIALNMGGFLGKIGQKRQ